MDRHVNPVRYALDAILGSFAILCLSHRRILGAVLLACWCLYPWPATTGVLGILISLLLASCLGFDREWIRSGRYLFNSLLLGLSIGYSWPIPESGADVCRLLMVLTLLSLATVFLSVILSSELHRHFRLPAMSLPFVIVHAIYCLLWLHPEANANVTPQMQVTPMLPWLAVPSDPRGIVFSLVLLAALLIYSRLLVAFACLGGCGAYLAAWSLAIAPNDPVTPWITVNGLCTGAALGGVLFIPSRASSAAAFVGGATATVLAVALSHAISAWGFWPYVLPFNLVVLTWLYAAKLRTAPRHLFPTPFTSESPEENFRRFFIDQRRFPEYGLPAVFCPFVGARVVTQGVSGKITHQGGWAEALDFEVRDEQGQPAPRPDSPLDQYYTFNTPVVSPESGVVAKVVEGLHDNAIGAADYANNWGNLVIVQLDIGYYATLCHLKCGSICVKEGQRVKEGDLLGVCGNSGRSQIPHLHLQLQTSPRVGAPTLPFRLRHYVETQELQSIYHTAGVPAEGSRVQIATTQRSVACCFDDISSREYRYQVCDDWQQRRESFTCQVDAYGDYVFRGSANDTLRARAYEQGFYVLNHSGGGTGHGVLYWLSIALTRVPYIDGHQVTWHDTAPLHRFLPFWADWLLDAGGPFFHYPTIAVTGSLQLSADETWRFPAEVKVSTTLSHHVPQFVLSGEIPQRIDAYLHRSRWVVGVVVTYANREVIISAESLR